MNKFITTDPGGLPFRSDDLRWLDQSYRSGFYALLSALEISPTKAVILSGCVKSSLGGSFSVSEGFVALAGETFYMPVQAYNNPPTGEAPYFEIDLSFNPTGLKDFEDGGSYETYQIRNLKLTVGSDQTTGVAFLDDAETYTEIIKNKIPEIGQALTLANNNTGFIAGNAQDIDALFINYGQHAGQLFTINNEISKDATEGQKGKIQLATQAEANAGTNEQKAITPKLFQDTAATPTQKGVIRTATAAEVLDANIANKAVTPKALYDSGKFGHIIRRASFYLANFPTTGTQNVTITFPNVGALSYVVVGSLRIANPANWNTNNDVIWSVTNKTATSFELCGREVVTGNTRDLYFDYVLIKL